MKLKELVRKNRSYRRFDESRTIGKEDLTDLVELARISASAANRQPLKFLISWDKEKNGKIFPNLAWAGYLKHWDGPEEGERPTGYIIILGDTSISGNFFVDHGIAAQSILLGATEKGYGGCIIASFKKDPIKKGLNIPDHLEPLLVIAFGKPGEEVVIEEVRDGDIKYYRDDDDIHHVPKRKLEDILV